MYLTRYFTQLGKDILIRFPKKCARLFEYTGEYLKFRKKYKGPLTTRFSDIYPCLNDKLATTPFDTHYTYHPAWAARILSQTMPAEHIDISSILHFSTIVSAFIPVKFYDYRPADLQLSNYRSGRGDLLNLPFPDNSVKSLSCMHTIEHIGLGRYGDILDPDGDSKAIAELKRVLAVEGNLLFVTPLGKPRIEFNAHRIYSYEMILDYFSPMQLLDFSLVTDDGQFINGADPSIVKDQRYACGCFWFRKTNQA